MPQKRYEGMVKEIGTVLSGIDAAQVERLAVRIAAAPRIFLAGVGRSGYMMRAFSMRLMHCGLEAHFLGDSTTTAARAGDLLIIGSGSGETESLKALAGKAKKIGMGILLFSAAAESSIASLADLTLVIPAPTPKSPQTMKLRSIQPMGSLLEQCLLLTLDELVMEVMDKMGLTAENMFTRHANLE